MGAIRNQFDSTFRDYNTFGVPASGNRKPPKVEIRGIGVLIEAQIAIAALAGGDPNLSSALVMPILSAAQAAQAAAENALIISQQTAAAIPATVAAQLAQAVSLATSAAVASQTNAAASATSAANSAALAQMAALTAPNVYATEAAGRAGVPDGNTFWTDLGDAGLGLFRRTSSTVSALVGKVVTAAMLASASGSALISHSVAAVGSVVRPVQAVLRDQAYNPKDFGAIGDAQPHPLSERFSTLAAAQAVYPFVTRLNQTQDWAGLQAALNAASITANSRGAVRMPLGYYVLSDSLQYPSFVTLEGVSQRGCVLYNQIVTLAAPQIVNKDPGGFIFVTLRNFTAFGGTHFLKLAAGEVSGVIAQNVTAALQTITQVEATSLQTMKFQDCELGGGGSGYAINVTGFPCNAIEFYNTRASSGASGLLKLRGFDGVHWYGGSMEGNGRSLKATATITGTSLAVGSLDDGLGPISVGDTVFGPGVAAGTVVASLGTGTGGVGTYNLNQPSTVTNKQLVIGPATINLEAGGTRATSVSFNGLYMEGTPRVALRSVGVTGISFNDCKFTWATGGEPYIFDTGTDIVAMGTNHFDTDVVGPLNTLLTGSSPRLGGNINTWSAAGQNACSLTTRRRDLSQAIRFDLLTFTREVPIGGNNNVDVRTGRLTVTCRGYDGNGNARRIVSTYRVIVESASTNTITGQVKLESSDAMVSSPTPETMIAQVRDASDTQLVLEVLTTGFNTALPSMLFATFDCSGVPILEAQRLTVAAL